MHGRRGGQQHLRRPLGAHLAPRCEEPRRRHDQGFRPRGGEVSHQRDEEAVLVIVVMIVRLGMSLW